MTTEINESKTLTKHVSLQCKCRYDEKKSNSDQWWNYDKCQCENKKHCVCEKDFAWNPVTCSCENGKCSASIMHHSAIMLDEIIEWYDKETKAVPTNINEKQVVCKTLITIALLIAISIYCYLRKN